MDTLKYVAGATKVADTLYNYARCFFSNFHLLSIPEIFARNIDGHTLQFSFAKCCATVAPCNPVVKCYNVEYSN